MKTALIYCENQFGLVDGKTAAALVRHSYTYTVVGVIDSSLAGRDAGDVLSGKRDGIPIFADLADALSKLPGQPDYYVYGKAPLDGRISAEERVLILEAMEHGMDIINGLHEFFCDDEEFLAAAARNGVRIVDVRKPPSLQNSHFFTGRIAEVNIPVVALLGTDCASGKMTTAVELNRALNDRGIKSVMVATGQSTLMQGSRYGVAIDALVSQFVVGEIEHAVLDAFDHERPDIILVEGQSAVSHPAFLSSLGILKGSMPDGVILQHPPARKYRVDFPQMAMPTAESEIKLIETVSGAKVIAIALSHEDMTRDEVRTTIDDYETRLGLPTTDVLSFGCERLIQALTDRFPELSTGSRHQGTRSTEL